MAGASFQPSGSDPTKYFTTKTVQEVLDKDTSELVKRPNIGMHLAAGAVESGLEVLRCLPTQDGDDDPLSDTSEYRKSGFPQMKAVLPAAIQEAVEVFNCSSEKFGNRSEIEKALETFVEYLTSRGCEDRMKTFARAADASSRVYASAMALMEITALAKKIKDWAKKVPEVEKQNPGVRKFAKDMDLPSLIKGLAKGLVAYAETGRAKKRTRKFGDCKDSDTSSGSSSSNGSGSDDSDSDGDSTDDDSKKPKREKKSAKQKKSKKKKTKKKNVDKKISGSESTSNGKRRKKKAKDKRHRSAPGHDRSPTGTKPGTSQLQAAFTTWSMGDAQQFQAEMETLMLEKIGNQPGGTYDAESLRALKGRVPQRVLELQPLIIAQFEGLRDHATVPNTEALALVGSLFGLSTQAAEFYASQSEPSASAATTGGTPSSKG